MGLLDRANALKEVESESPPKKEDNSVQTPVAHQKRATRGVQVPEAAKKRGGLLERANRFRDQSTSSESPSFSSQSSGSTFADENYHRIGKSLLQRAERFRNEDSHSREKTGLDLSPPPLSRTGLLARAEALRAGEDPWHEKVKKDRHSQGLLARAESFRHQESDNDFHFDGEYLEPHFEHESPVLPTNFSTLSREFDEQGFDSIKENSNVTQQNQNRGENQKEGGAQVATDPSPQEAIEPRDAGLSSDEGQRLDGAEDQHSPEAPQAGPGEEDESRDTHQSAEEPAEDRLETDDYENEPLKLEEELPDLDYEGDSDQLEDPAFDGKQEEESVAGLPPGMEPDPFDEWEMEAEEDAEKVAKSLTETGDSLSLKDDKDDFLLDDEGDFGTVPAEEHVGTKKKIDNYLTIFDIARELSAVESPDELWESLMYSIMGQLGSEKICIFSSEKALRTRAILHPVAFSGFDPEGEMTLKPGDELYDSMENAESFKYAEEFGKTRLSQTEQSIMELTDAYLVVPVRFTGSMLAILTLSRPISGSDYTLDDLEFIKLLSELASSEARRILLMLEHDENKEELAERNELQTRVLTFARSATTATNLDDLYDELNHTLNEYFHVDHFSLVLFSPIEQVYKTFAGRGISTASIEKFELSMTSDLIATISNITRVYEVPSFRSDPDVINNYTSDDLAMMHRYWIIPLINLNWLVGFITVHNTTQRWTGLHREQVVALSQIAAPAFANTVILNERESIFRDPFSPLEERLRKEIHRAAEFQSSVSIVEIRIKNIRRIFQIAPGDEAVQFLNDTGKTISDILYDTDFMARLGQGRYTVILPGRSRKEAEVFVQKIKTDLSKDDRLGRSFEVQYSFQVLNYPEDGEDSRRILSLLD